MGGGGAPPPGGTGRGDFLWRAPPRVFNTPPHGRAPRFAAIDSRASSSSRRAARPDPCSDDAFPAVPSTAVIASTATGNMGVVAA